MAEVRLQGVSKRFGATEAVAGLDLELADGEFVVLLGPTGAGKTTTLRLVAGLEKPDAGRVFIGGHDVTDTTPAPRDVSFVFQQYSLYPHLSVFDNLAFPMREKTDLPETLIEDLVLLKLNAVGLRGAAKLMPSELSGGMTRRVGLARAIALDPSLIMYDEPFAGLDPISCNVVGNLIRRLNDALGVTSIVVSYDAQEALKIVDYVYFLADGVIAAEGETAAVKVSTDPFVHQFIRGQPDGPVPFHYPSGSYADDMDMTARV